MLKVPAVLGCGSRTFNSADMASDVIEIAVLNPLVERAMAPVGS